MKKLVVYTVVVALLLGVSAYQSIVSANLDQASLPERALTTDPLFDRSAFIAKVKEIFKPIERLLPEGDTLDYNRTILFSGLPNNTNEHIVIVPMSKSSLSRQKARRLGIDLTWQEANPIALAAYYIIAPNDFSSLEAGKPYLTLAISWEKRVVLDQTGTVVKEAEIMWLRGCNDEQAEHDHVFGWMGKDWFLFLGNAYGHDGDFCVIISEDQVGRRRR